MVEGQIAAYLQAVDDALPGFVDKLYVVGSAALGAWQPSVSDVDTIIFTSRQATPADIAVLRVLKPTVDGPYLGPQDGYPMDRPVVPFVVMGNFREDRPCGELTPVVWLILQRYGIRVRGPEVAALGIDVDPAAVRAYLLDNLRTYWQASIAEVPAYLETVDPAAPHEGEPLVELVLGPPRLHYTLANYDIVPKVGGGMYIAKIFPEHGELIERAICWRSDPKVKFTNADLAEATELTRKVIDSALS